VELIEEGKRVKVKDNYPGPTYLFGREGTVQPQYDHVKSRFIRVRIDGERTTDLFFENELELIN
jgi:hypothetical protein